MCQDNTKNNKYKFVWLKYPLLHSQLFTDFTLNSCPVSQNNKVLRWISLIVIWISLAPTFFLPILNSCLNEKKLTNLVSSVTESQRYHDHRLNTTRRLRADKNIWS